MGSRRRSTSTVVAGLVVVAMVLVGLGLVVAAGGGRGSASNGGDDGGSRSGLSVADAWTGPNPSLTAVYLTIANEGDDDRLVAVATDIAGKVELMGGDSDIAHTSASGAQPVDLAVPSGTTKLEPGGSHLMLEDLTGALQPGDQFPLRLEFQRTGTITVQVEVVSWDQAAQRAGQG